MVDVSQTRPIALLTDFGYKDIFVGILKGVILSINPRAAILDLSHGVRPRDIFHGSFLLDCALGYFPRGTVFCVVVDPGVGTDRRPVLIKTKDYYFVGPDNGVLWQAAQKNQMEAAIHLTQKAYFLEKISSTFHGRDIFVPIAAHLSLGMEIDKFGIPINDLLQLVLPVPEKNGNKLILTILDIDIYGNICLNITWEQFKAFVGDNFYLEVGNRQISRICTAYAFSRDSQPFLLSASSGYMEIAVKNGNAAEQLAIKCLDKVVLTR